MNLRKLYSILAVIVLTLFVFTSCDPIEDDPITPSGTEIPIKANDLMGGCVNETTLVFTWTHSQKDSTWFKDYIVTIKEEGADLFAVTDTISKSMTQYTFNEAKEGVVYEFTIAGRNIDNKVGAKATFKWATASQFKKNDTESDIRVYGSASAYGSGLELFNTAGGAPKIWKIANEANWNLGLFARDGKVLFGSASALGYTQVKNPADAEITGLMNVDLENLGNLVVDTSLDKFAYSKKSIDLVNDPIAKKAEKGVIFFARTLDKKHYAKVLVLKKAGNFLQGSGDNVFVQVYISYQKAENVPYAKR
ncbi:MAG: fibronectin type III domain-containing protein [Ignavibacteria bacterium]|jgi:hypothetical protein|nr:fibronectin type III domain-containing protein [Ignavibacteria bacterium]